MKIKFMITVLLSQLISCIAHDSNKSPIDFKKNSLEQTVLKENAKDSIVIIESFSKIMENIENNVDLNNQELKVLLDSIFLGSEEALSEGYGYLLFEYLRDNTKRNDDLSKVISLKAQKDRERILSDLVGLMCIDILDEDIDYNTFIKKFTLFDKSKKAETAFKKCLENR